MMNRLARLLCRLVLAAWATSMALAAESVQGSECLDCHGDPDLTAVNEAGQTVSLHVDGAKYGASVHGAMPCAACHGDISRQHPDDTLPAKRVDCAACHEHQSSRHGASLHGAAVRGGAEAARCSNCHGGHQVLRDTSPDSTLHHSKISATCGACHPRSAQAVAESVHGLAAIRGERDAALCTDCHFEHAGGVVDGASARRLSAQICGKCHAAEPIAASFRPAPDPVKTFYQSYHGLAVQFGSTRAANCASCHGYHRILPSRNPDSSIHPNRLVETCGQCHPGATENFARGRIHGDSGRGKDTGSVVNRWVRSVYITIILTVVGLMAAHNLAVWLLKAAATRRAPGRSVMRMERTQRIQHMLLFVSFIVLAITGFALKHPDSWMAWMLGADDAIRRGLHRIFGLLLLATAVWHVLYVLTTAEGKRLFCDLWPRRGDVRGAADRIRSLAGKTPVRPRCGRFGYVEKIEYWAVVWGVVIMGVTGLMIWLKIDVTRILPRWAVEVATTVHYYEAILACLAVVVWHAYHVVFDPGVYPMNWAWWDGRVADEPCREKDPPARSASNQSQS